MEADLQPIDLLPLAGFIGAYRRFSVLTKHVALLCLLNRDGRSSDALLACIALDIACSSWVGTGAYLAAAALHAALQYSGQAHAIYYAGYGYCVAVAATDPLLAVDLAAMWWVYKGKDTVCQKVIAFLAMRRLAA